MKKEIKPVDKLRIGYLALEKLTSKDEVTFVNLMVIGKIWRGMILAINTIVTEGTKEEKDQAVATYKKMFNIVIAIQRKLKIPEELSLCTVPNLLALAKDPELIKYCSDMGKVCGTLKEAYKEGTELALAGKSPLKTIPRSAAQKKGKNKLGR